MAESLSDDESHNDAIRGASTTAEVTDGLMLEYSGEDSVENIRELVLRDLGIVDMGPAMRRLCRIEVLSLSHNRLQALPACISMHALTDLNINFNRVTSLAPLAHCRALERLFASSNKLSSLAPLRQCTRLRELCAFRNVLPSLSECIEVLRQLPDLVSLELGSNPCALGEPYRHELVHALPNLRALDGDGLAELDRELSAEHVERQPGGQALWERHGSVLAARAESAARGAGVGAAAAGRPVTAPVQPRCARGIEPSAETAACLSASAAQHTSAARPQTAAATAGPRPRPGVGPRPPAAAQARAARAGSVDRAHSLESIVELPGPAEPPARSAHADVLTLDGDADGARDASLTPRHAGAEENVHASANRAPVAANGAHPLLAEFEAKALLAEHSAQRTARARAEGAPTPSAAQLSARGSAGDGAEAEGGGVGTALADALSLRRPAAERLRLIAATSAAAGGGRASPARPRSTATAGRSGGPTARSCAPALSAAGADGADEDGADDSSTVIRRLVSLVQEVAAERDVLQRQLRAREPAATPASTVAAGAEAGVPAGARPGTASSDTPGGGGGLSQAERAELARLRAENANMWGLLDENRRLRARLKAVAGLPETADD